MTRFLILTIAMLGFCLAARGESFGDGFGEPLGHGVDGKMGYGINGGMTARAHYHVRNIPEDRPSYAPRDIEPEPAPKEDLAGELFKEQQAQQEQSNRDREDERRDREIRRLSDELDSSRNAGGGEDIITHVLKKLAKPENNDKQEVEYDEEGDQ